MRQNNHGKELRMISSTLMRSLDHVLRSIEIKKDETQHASMSVSSF